MQTNRRGDGDGHGHPRRFRLITAFFVAGIIATVIVGCGDGKAKTTSGVAEDTPNIPVSLPEAVVEEEVTASSTGGTSSSTGSSSTSSSGSTSSTSSSSGGSAITFAQVQGAGFTGTCASCHTGTHPPFLNSRNSYRNHFNRVLSCVQGNCPAQASFGASHARMPPTTGYSGLTSAQIQILIDWRDGGFQ